MTRHFALLLLALGSFATAACDASSTSRGDDSGVKSTDDTWVRPAGPTPVEAHGQLSVQGTDLVDQNGAQVQLKGVSSMWLNWETDGYAQNADALVWMRDHWGLSVIRAAMGVEPTGAYLTDPVKAKSQVTKIVDNAVAAGVYVIIDWHDHNATMHKEEAKAFFGEMAQTYAGVPNVIFETFNEPLKLDWTTELKPYHEEVVAAIREAEPNNVIILGTPLYSQDVDIAAISPLEGANLMYTLHFYACTHGSYLISKLQSARNMGLPIFVTEWGATDADGGTDGIVCADAATQWMTVLKRENISWAAWKLDNCAADSSCILATSAPLNGGWTTDYLHGHGIFVRDAMRQ